MSAEDEKSIATGDDVSISLTVSSPDGYFNAYHGSTESASCKVTIYPAVKTVNLYSGSEKMSGGTLDYTDGMKLLVRNSSLASQRGWTVRSSNKAVSATMDGNVVTLSTLPGKTLKPSTKITLTVTATDGSGKSCRVKLTAK